MKYTAGLLDEIGIGGGRLRMYNLSSAQGARFAEVCAEMTEVVRGLGPSPLAGGARGEEEATETVQDRVDSA